VITKRVGEVERWRMGEEEIEKIEKTKSQNGDIG